MDESTNKIKVWNFRGKNEQSASASVIGQRPNFTITYCSASADCEKCSFGHCLYKRLLDELQLQKHGFPYLEENKKDRWEKFVSKMDHYATCMQEIKNFFCMFAFHYNSSLKQGGIPRKLQLEQARILIKKHLHN